MHISHCKVSKIIQLFNIKIDKNRIINADMYKLLFFFFVFWLFLMELLQLYELNVVVDFFRTNLRELELKEALVINRMILICMICFVCT